MLYKANFNLRAYEEGDEKQILPLLDLVFGEWPKFDLECTVKEHWSWKLIDTPTKLNPIVVAELEDGKIVGVTHGIIKRTKIGEEIVLIRKGTEVAVHPQYRRMGVYKGLVDYREKISTELGAVMSYSLTGNSIVINYKKDGDEEGREPEFPQPIKQLVRINDLNKFIKHLRRRREIPWGRSLLIKLGYSILNLSNKFKQIFINEKTKNQNFTIKKIPSFDDSILQFWNEVKNDYDFIVEKSREYLNWRYCDPRGGNYDVWGAQENSHILGYIVLRVNRMDPYHPVGYIMEVLAFKEREDVVSALVKHADKFFEGRVNAIYFTIVAGHPYEDILKKYSFIDSRRSLHLFYRVYKNFHGLERFEKISPGRLHYQFEEFDSV
jgi:hypothetical protein